MKVLFTLCGRAGSKGVKNKNVATFCGVPLPYMTLAIIEAYRRAHPNAEYIIGVNTDSDQLKELVEKAQLKEIQYVQRKKALAGDVVSKVDVIRDTYYQIEKNGFRADLIIDCDITSPLRRLVDLETLIEKKVAGNADVVYTVCESRRNPYFNMVKKEVDSYARVIESNYTARQQAPEIYDMNASMYGYSPEFLMSENSLFESQSDIVIMEDNGILDIDSTRDLWLMEAVAKTLFEKEQAYAQIYLLANEMMTES